MTTTSTATTNRPQSATTRSRHPVPVTRGNTALAPSREPVKSKPPLRVAPPAPVSVPRAPFVALVLVVVIAGVLGILVLNTKINENAFTLNHLQDQQNHLDQQEQQLDQHLADLESPNSLRAAALRLGLIDSGTPAYLPLPNGQTVGVPQPAAPAQPGR